MGGREWEWERGSCEFVTHSLDRPIICLHMWVCPSARVRARPSDLAGVSRPADRLRMSAAACVGIVQMRSRSEIRHCRGMKATEPTRHFLLWPGGRGLPRTREGGNECKTPSLLFSSCEDCVGRRSRRGSLWLACCHKLICPLERQREGGRGRASVALIASRSARVNFRSSAVKTTLQILREAMQICLPPHQRGGRNVVRSVTGSLCLTQS